MKRALLWLFPMYAVTPHDHSWRTIFRMHLRQQAIVVVAAVLWMLCFGVPR